MVQEIHNKLFGGLNIYSVGNMRYALNFREYFLVTWQKWEVDDKVNHKELDACKESYIELNSISYVAAGYGIGIIIEFWRKWDVVMTFHKVIWQHLLRGTEEIYENPQSV
jgi:hypothetical protein